MRAFFVDAGEHQIIDDYIEGYPIWYIGRLCDVVFARTRGQARAYATHDWNLEFTDKMSIRILPGEYDRTVGFVDYKDEFANELWYYAALTDKNNKVIDCVDCGGVGCDQCVDGKLVVDKNYGPEKEESDDQDS